MGAEILPRRYEFDRVPRSVQALEALSQHQVEEFFQKYLDSTSPDRRKLSARVLGTSAKTVADTDYDSTAHCNFLTSLQDIRDFQGGCKTFVTPPPATMPPACS